MTHTTNRLTFLSALIAVLCFVTAPANASVINLTFTEDIGSFSSTWRIEDNGGNDYSGIDNVLGTFWQLELTMDSSAVLQDSIVHLNGPHGESIAASSLDYGVLPEAPFTNESFVIHDSNGHRDEFSLTSVFNSGGYDITLSGIHVVPIPAAVWLFASGLGMLGWMKRRA